MQVGRTSRVVSYGFYARRVVEPMEVRRDPDWVRAGAVTAVMLGAAALLGIFALFVVRAGW